MRISNTRNSSLSNRRRSAGNLPLSSRCNKYNSLYNKRSPGNLHCRRGTWPGNLCLKMRFTGDSPKGPLNNRGETRLKPTKNAKHEPTRAPKAHTQHKHDLGGPRGLPGQHSVHPSSEDRLARGIDTPSGEVRLDRGPYAPSGGVRLARGLSPAPRTRSASLKG
jgi:hypothetical protein